ncbi:MAG TPA: endonuclease/exonuclease/phosphatase family protein [Bryobacteraceae bacterium]|nr:endonuclease/exonuclease/phosphatase family protein [Bryobacteraceae bacterium]
MSQEPPRALEPADRTQSAAADTKNGAPQPGDPELLTWDELIQLYKEEVPPPALNDKLHKLLTTPFVRNTASDSGHKPLKPDVPAVGQILRVTQWNIERGLEFDAIRLAFTDSKRFNALMEDKGSKADDKERDEIFEQIRVLQQSDLIVLNEVDWGMNRTGFRNVGAELATALGMNYAYGVEFVEVDPITMGIDQQVIVREVEDAYAAPHQDRDEMLAYVKKIMTPDPQHYKGLHGTAILSRYRLDNVHVIRFATKAHDWYADEKKVSIPEKLEGKVSAAVFKEQLLRQVRRGGRMMLLADIADPEFPSGKITIVATHLEDVTTPGDRQKELQEILDHIHSVDHPLILTGDMNTSTHTGVPISVTRALKQRFGDAKWWAEQGAAQAARYLTPFGWAYSASVGVVGVIRKVDDPTRANIPFVGDNPEAKFFSMLQKFRSADGSSFDFRGEKESSFNDREGTLANSNERSEKGFVPTSELGKSFGIVGQYKLDWMFILPPNLDKPKDKNGTDVLAPHYGRTLKALNHSIPQRISDHNPITVDLPLGTGWGQPAESRRPAANPNAAPNSIR